MTIDPILLFDSFPVFNKAALAVSGGIDSTVMLHLFSRFYPKEKLFVLTVDHMLRTESAQEVQFVRNYCKDIGLSCTILREESRKFIKGNKQDYARKLRYSLLLQECSKRGIDCLVVAHNQNDQAETLFMNIARGSGLEGLTGMSASFVKDDVSVLRPLIFHSRAEISEYAKQYKLTWIEDPSNQFGSRALHRKLLKDMDKIGLDRISLLTIHSQRSLEAILYYVRRSIEECISVSQFGFISIDSILFCEYPEEVSMRILLYAILCVGGLSVKPRYKSFRLIYDNVVNNNEGSFTLNRCKISIKKNNIVIKREIIHLPVKIKADSTKDFIWDNRFLCRLKVSDENIESEIIKKAFIAAGWPNQMCDIPKDVFATMPILYITDNIYLYGGVMNFDLKWEYKIEFIFKKEFWKSRAAIGI